MRELVVNTTLRAPLERLIYSEINLSSRQGSASVMSSSNQPESPSDVESSSVSPAADISIKSENYPSPSLENLQDARALSALGARRRSASHKDVSSNEENKRAQVKERSKTGCLTCRKRKKKCDEAKPFCNNCTKTNYVCGGYPSLKYWNPSLSAPGSDGGQNEKNKVEPSLKLPTQEDLPLFPAVEIEEDYIFLHHYVNNTSRILSLDESEGSNPWKELILPMAKDDKCLMHSVLALAGSHLTRSTENQRLNDRHMFHVDAAVSSIRRRLAETEPASPHNEPLLASMMFQFLLSKNDSTWQITPQACLKATRAFFVKPLDTEFWRFAWTFFKYHEFSTTFTSLPGPESRPNFEMEVSGASPSSTASETNESVPQNFNMLVGLVNVSFMTVLSKITALRDKVRQRQLQQIRPIVHYSMMTTATDLGRDIYQWSSGQPPGTPRWVAAELYRRASMLYLLRTVRAASNEQSREAFAATVQQGLDCLKVLPPTDPVQSGLLLPTFLLGCGAFDQSQRVAVGHALDTIERYSGFGNVVPVRAILQRVWETMDAGDVERSWDWETLTQEMGYSALIT